MLKNHPLNSILLEKFRMHDPNHLFFGCTPVLGWRSSYEWDSVYAEYVDVYNRSSFDEIILVEINLS